jgi:hypothetical protein
MDLTIDFDEILTAFEWSTVDQHYFIDTEKNEIVFISDLADMDADEKLEEMECDRYIGLPPRIPKDDYMLMELFIYQIHPFELAEKFHKAIEGAKPFRRFKDLLSEYPKLEKKWFAFRDEHLKNECINWLVNKGIVLKGQKLIPDIEIKELGKEELDKLPGELRGFGPVACAKCGKKEGIKGRFFEVNVSPDNMLIQRETEKLMEEKFGVGHFGDFVGPRNFLTAAKCPQCGSEEVFWDF